jgi:hypothetical protein
LIAVLLGWFVAIRRRDTTLQAWNETIQPSFAAFLAWIAAFQGPFAAFKARRGVSTLPGNDSRRERDTERR